MTNHETVKLLNGSQIVETLRNLTWIDQESAFYGTAEDGSKWYVWTIDQLV